MGFAAVFIFSPVGLSRFYDPSFKFDDLTSAIFLKLLGLQVSRSNLCWPDQKNLERTPQIIKNS